MSAKQKAAKPVQGPAVDANAVEWTDEYDAFDRDDNRPVDYKHVDKLAIRMSDVGYLPGYPVVINSQCVVRDGQHRLLAAQKAGVRFCYIVDDTIDVLSVAEANRLVHKWTSADHLSYRARRGDKNAQWVEEFAASSKLSLPAVLRACKRCLSYDPRDNRNHISSLAKKLMGEWIKQFDDIAAVRPELRESGLFVESSFALISRQEYNHERMMAALSWQSTKLVKCPSRVHYDELLINIYNSKAHTASRLTVERTSRPPGFWQGK